MSKQNVEIIRGIVQGFIDLDLPLVEKAQWLPEELFAPDYVWDMSNFEGWPGQREFTGLDGFYEFFAEWTEPYSEYDQEIQRLEDAGGDRVVAIMRQRARLRESDSWVDLHFALLYTFSEGLIQRTQVYAPPEEALEAAGLSE
jgi:ketosteroid isomerase-like protein